ncbi:MAG: DUF1003 domain-containing protein [bacterium]|nr:DUF1003 domain-containing protein [bacterium]
MEFKDLRKRIGHPQSFLDKMANAIASFFGSWWAIILHSIWFFVWFWFDLEVDLLTLIVSLEAIYLGMVLLMYSNRMASRDDIRDEADYQADLHADQQLTDVKQKLEKIHRDIEEIKNR